MIRAIPLALLLVLASGLPGLGQEASPPASEAPKPETPKPEAPSAEKTPDVMYGEEGLPDKVKALRRRIIEATKTGDVEKLRPVIESNETPPSFPGGGNSDPIATLKVTAGDQKGVESLAILQETLEAGYVHVDAGTPQEMFIWPYFARYPLTKLSDQQLVELFRLITAGDFQDMQDKGVYSFYRVGIGPDGTLHFFEDGD